MSSDEALEILDRLCHDSLEHSLAEVVAHGNPEDGQQSYDFIRLNEIIGEVFADVDRLTEENNSLLGRALLAEENAARFKKLGIADMRRADEERAGREQAEQRATVLQNALNACTCPNCVKATEVLGRGNQG